MQQGLTGEEGTWNSDIGLEKFPFNLPLNTIRNYEYKYKHNVNVDAKAKANLNASQEKETAKPTTNGKKTN